MYWHWAIAAGLTLLGVVGIVGYFPYVSWAPIAIAFMALAFALICTLGDYLLRITRKAMRYKQEALDCRLALIEANGKIEQKDLDIRALKSALRITKETYEEKLSKCRERQDIEERSLRMQLEVSGKAYDSLASRCKETSEELETLKRFYEDERSERDKALSDRLSGLRKEASLVRIRGELIESNLTAITSDLFNSINLRDEAQRESEAEGSG